jgi:hypothetical protein
MDKQSGSILYEDSPRYDLSYLTGPVVFVSLLLILALSFYFDDPLFGLLLLAPAVLVGLANYALLPRKIFILEDRIKIAQGFAFSTKILFSTIESAQITTIESDSGVFTPLRLNWETSHAKNGSRMIIRKKKMNATISPKNPDLFLDNLNKAVDAWRNRNEIS